MSNIYCKMHGCPKEALQSEEYCQTHYLRPYEERLKKGATKGPLTAGSILQTAAQHMEERAATYDQQGGEAGGIVPRQNPILPQ